MPRYPTEENGDIKYKAYGAGTDFPYEGMLMITCKLVNKTKYTWRWEDFRLQEYTNFNSYRSGVYRHQIDHEIHPNGATVIQLFSSKNFRGVEAWITYNTDAGPLQFHWNSPFAGTNSYHTYQIPAEFDSIHNSSVDRFANGTTAAPIDPEYFGSKIDGQRPQFEWTIKQRPEAAKPKKTDHFYTLDGNGEGMGASGHLREGIAGYVFTTEQPNTVPLYRFFHSGIFDHFYSLDRNGEGATDWKFEHIQCWMPANKDNGAVGWYRFWDSKDHFYTTDPNGEFSKQLGYHSDGERAFIYPTQVPGSVPLFRWLLTV